DTEDLFTVLADRTVAPDDLLPDTGAGIEIERLASPAFIDSPDYGTHASTVLRIRRDGSFDVEERRFLRGEETGRVVFAGAGLKPTLP
ncbi:MAG TPA: NRDE family protein, partial [Aeromicrobium sp.]|nr:NRDE family protein [Aeromicrobium sp.]